MSYFKDFLKKKYKLLQQSFFKLYYGKVKIATQEEVYKYLQVNNVEIEQNNYKIFLTKNSRLFTTTVHDQSVIINNKLFGGI